MNTGMECQYCKCTDARVCPGGCHWVSIDVCSNPKCVAAWRGNVAGLGDIHLRCKPGCVEQEAIDAALNNEYGPDNRDFIDGYLLGHAAAVAKAAAREAPRKDSA